MFLEWYISRSTVDLQHIPGDAGWCHQTCCSVETLKDKKRHFDIVLTAWKGEKKKLSPHLPAPQTWLHNTVPIHLCSHHSWPDLSSKKPLFCFIFKLNPFTAWPMVLMHQESGMLLLGAKQEAEARDGQTSRSLRLSTATQEPPSCFSRSLHYMQLRCHTFGITEKDL